MLDSIGNFFSENVGRIIAVLIILITAYVLQKMSERLVNRTIQKAARPELFKSKRDEELRELTLQRIINTTIKVVIWTFAVLLILAQVNINLGPLIAGAGIAGVALGFGAQSLVKDVINGMFILLENQFRVGDVIELNKEVSGTVEKFSLRTTVLRDLDGMMHTVPNGEIVLATNMTMDYGSINLDVGIGYESDLEKVEKVVNQVGQNMADSEEWGEFITKPPKFSRVNDFGDSAIIIKITGKTVTVKQWSVAGELRKRLKIAFDKNGIEIPFPQRVIHQAPKPKTTKK